MTAYDISLLDIQNTLFTKNIATRTHGGAISANTVSVMRIFQCNFTHNEAIENGGAIMIRDSRNIRVRFDECLFYRNIVK